MLTKPLFASGWEVTGINRADKFFAALTTILPPAANLCFEGTSIAPDIRTLLASNVVASTFKIPLGTVWPKPKLFHVHATEQFVRELAALAKAHAEPEICDHFYAYKDSRGLMQWHDAFDDPLLIDESIVEKNLQAFCRLVGAHYSRWRAA